VHATAKAPHRRQTVGVDLDGIAEYRYGFHVALFTNFKFEIIEYEYKYYRMCMQNRYFAFGFTFRYLLA
jgi:hypothetical protein